jgi:hypothetical protein
VAKVRITTQKCEFSQVAVPPAIVSNNSICFFVGPSLPNNGITESAFVLSQNGYRRDIRTTSIGRLKTVDCNNLLARSSLHRIASLQISVPHTPPQGSLTAETFCLLNESGPHAPCHRKTTPNGRVALIRPDSSAAKKRPKKEIGHQNETHTWSFSNVSVKLLLALGLEINTCKNNHFELSKISSSNTVKVSVRFLPSELPGSNQPSRCCNSKIPRGM